ncbi:MAG TPA: hypothetical protein VF126_00665 [Acidobacteriaceae bacterium]|jgi:hypothetical protein
MPGTLDLKRKQRFEFMSCLYNRTDGAEDGLVEIETIAQEIGLSEGEAFLIAQYLAKENLIHLRLRHVVSITHGGIVEVEAALRRPDTSTEHFPPLHAVAQNGNGAALTAAAAESGTEVSCRATEVAVIRPFLAALELQVPKLHLDPDPAAEFCANIGTARAQLSSPRPRRQVIAVCLESVLATIEQAGPFGLTTDLRAQLPAIRAFLQ